RLAANITGHQVRDIRQQMVENPDAEAYYANALASSKVMFAFDSNPEWYDIEDEVSAYVELYDRFPDIIIADNLRNVYTSSESEHAGYGDSMHKLLDLTRDAGAAVIVLPRRLASGKDNVATKPAP